MGSDELTADGADSNDELIDIGPFISCDYLEENVGSRYGARFGTLDLPSFEQPEEINNCESEGDGEG